MCDEADALTRADATTDRVRPRCSPPFVHKAAVHGRTNRRSGAERASASLLFRAALLHVEESPGRRIGEPGIRKRSLANAGLRPIANPSRKRRLHHRQLLSAERRIVVGGIDWLQRALEDIVDDGAPADEPRETVVRKHLCTLRGIGDLVARQVVAGVDRVARLVPHDLLRLRAGRRVVGDVGEPPVENIEHCIGGDVQRRSDRARVETQRSQRLRRHDDLIVGIAVGCDEARPVGAAMVRIVHVDGAVAVRRVDIRAKVDDRNHGIACPEFVDAARLIRSLQRQRNRDSRLGPGCRRIVPADPRVQIDELRKLITGVERESILDPDVVEGPPRKSGPGSMPKMFTMLSWYVQRAP